MFTITNGFSYIQATNETTEREKAERNSFFSHVAFFFFFFSNYGISVIPDLVLGKIITQRLGILCVLLLFHVT